MRKMIQTGLLILLGWSCLAFSVPSPVTALQETSNQMLQALKNNPQAKNNRSYTEVLARKILLPHVDVPTMSRLVLGREAWLNATPAQQEQFKQEFATFMIRTYSAALASYTNEAIKFLPMRDDYQHQERVLVKSLILQQGGPSIPVDYRLVLKSDQWMLYDITVDSVSMVRSFRSQFNSELSKGGMNGLLVAMQKHNSMKI